MYQIAKTYQYGSVKLIILSINFWGNLNSIVNLQIWIKGGKLGMITAQNKTTCE